MLFQLFFFIIQLPFKIIKQILFYSLFRNTLYFDYFYFFFIIFIITLAASHTSVLMKNKKKLH